MGFCGFGFGLLFDVLCFLNAGFAVFVMYLFTCD